MTQTVATVLRSGGVYDANYVEALRRGVGHWLSTPHTFAVLTDTPDAIKLRPLADPVHAGPAQRERRGEYPHQQLKVVPLEHGFPGWWSKMELFRPEVRELLGDVLYVDLDTIMIGPLEPLFGQMGWPIMLRDFYRTDGLGSGLMHIPAHGKMVDAVWERFIVANQDRTYSLFHGDQEFLESCWAAWRIARWQDLLPGKIVSYKVHCDPTKGAPSDAAVVCFHGTPKPHQLTQGWVGKHWRTE